MIGKRSVRKFSAVAIVFSLLLLGMNVNDSLGQPKPKTVKIGAIYPLTGVNANAGQRARLSVMMAADIFNKAYPNLPLLGAEAEGLPNLGGAQIEIIFADHRSDPAVARAEAERMITNEKVVALLGCHESACTMTASDAAEKYGIPFLNPSSSSPRLTERGYKWFYRTGPEDRQLMKNVAKFYQDLNEKKGVRIKNIAVVAEDSIVGQDLADMAKKFLPEGGFDVVKDILYPKNTTDVSGVVLAIKRMNPDFLIQGTELHTDGLLFMRTYKQYEVAIPTISTWGVATRKDWVDAVGRDADYLFRRYLFGLDMAQRRPIIGRMSDMFLTRAGTPLDENTGREFDGSIVLFDAINRAGSTEPEAILKALQMTDIPADRILMPFGGIKFDEKHQNIRILIPFGQLYNKESNTVWPWNIASKEPIIPIPPWRERK